jgi:hypothetical protein
MDLRGAVALIKAVAPIMRSQGPGRMLNIASVIELNQTGLSIAYAVSIDEARDSFQRVQWGEPRAWKSSAPRWFEQW